MEKIQVSLLGLIGTYTKGIGFLLPETIKEN